MGFGVVSIQKPWKFLSLPEASTAMQLYTGGAMADGNMLSNGTMEFYEAADDEGNAIEIAGFILKEYCDAAAVPQKIKCRIYFFKKCAVGTLAGSAFSFTDQLLDDLVGYIDIAEADWTDLEGGKHAFVRAAFEKPIKLDPDIKIVQCIAVAKEGVKTFTADHSMVPELIVAE